LLFDRPLLIVYGISYFFFRRVSIPILMGWRGLFSAELATAVVSVLGLLVTLWMALDASGVEGARPRRAQNGGSSSGRRMG
jgi:hypothetical protein